MSTICSTTRAALKWNGVSNFHCLFGDLGKGYVLDLLRTVCRQRRSSQRLVLLHEGALRQNGPSLLEIAVSAAHLCHFPPHNAHVVQLCVSLSVHPATCVPSRWAARRSRNLCRWSTLFQLNKRCSSCGISCGIDVLQRGRQLCSVAQSLSSDPILRRRKPDQIAPVVPRRISASAGWSESAATSCRTLPCRAGRDSPALPRRALH